MSSFFSGNDGAQHEEVGGRVTFNDAEQEMVLQDMARRAQRGEGGDSD